jgi:hypothetical protein
MRRNRSFSSRNDRGMTPKAFHGDWGVSQRISRVCLSQLLRSAGRFVSLRWLRVRWRCSLSLLRLQQSHKTARGGTLTRIMPAIIGTITAIVIIATARALRMRRDLPIRKPDSYRMLFPAIRLPTARLLLADSVHRTWSPKRAVPGASRAGSAAWRGYKRAALPTLRPASHPTPAPPPRLRQVVSVHPASSPRRAAMSAATRPAAEGCGVRGS